MDLKFYFQGKNKSLAKISIVVCYTHMSSSRSIDSESEISLNNTKKTPLSLKDQISQSILRDGDGE